MPKTQVSSVFAEYPGQRDDEYEPADPHPAVFMSFDRVPPTHLLSRSSRGRSSASPQTFPGIAPDCGRTSLCNWSRRSNMFVQRARCVQRQKPSQRPCRKRDPSQLLCCSFVSPWDHDFGLTASQYVGLNRRELCISMPELSLWISVIRSCIFFMSFSVTFPIPTKTFSIRRCRSPVAIAQSSGLHRVHS